MLVNSVEGSRYSITCYQSQGNTCAVPSRLEGRSFDNKPDRLAHERFDIKETLILPTLCVETHCLGCRGMLGLLARSLVLQGPP